MEEALLTSLTMDPIVSQKEHVTSDFIPYFSSRLCAKILLTSGMTDFTRQTHRKLDFKLKTCFDSSITVNKIFRTVIPPVTFICKIGINHVFHIIEVASSLMLGWKNTERSVYYIKVYWRPKQCPSLLEKVSPNVFIPKSCDGPSSSM